MTWGARHLEVRYGATTALERVSVVVPAGQVTAVVGGDGAGKSTLLRVLAGIPIPHRGAVARPEPQHVAFVPTGSGTIQDLTVAENLDFVARAYRLRDWRDRAERLLERTDLAPFRTRLARDLSGGMRQKLGVIMGMLPAPELLVLDEPTTGVDPVSRSEVWRLIAAAAGEGAAILVASTYLDEAERASTVLVLHYGRTLLAGTPEDVIASLTGSIVDVDRPSEPTRAWPRGPRWREWRPDGDEGGVRPDLEDAVIAASLAAEEAGR
jgi:ABC-2 type transport system ATP-binding protein